MADRLQLCQMPPKVVDGAPWPVVGECHASYIKGHSCPQVDGGHEHAWVAWHDAPRPAGNTATGIPVRCRTCGARKCDLPACMLRRHHRGDHELY